MSDSQTRVLKYTCLTVYFVFFFKKKIQNVFFFNLVLVIVFLNLFGLINFILFYF
jgi:hypothetical protein